MIIGLGAESGGMGLARIASRVCYAVAVGIPVVFVLVFVLMVAGGATVLEGTIFTLVLGTVALVATLGAAISGYGLGRYADTAD